MPSGLRLMLTCDARCRQAKGWLLRCNNMLCNAPVLQCSCCNWGHGKHPAEAHACFELRR